MYAKNSLVKDFFQFQVFLFFLCSCASQREVEESASHQLFKSGVHVKGVECAFNRREDGTPIGHAEWICSAHTELNFVVLVCDGISKKCRRHQANDLTD